MAIDTRNAFSYLDVNDQDLYGVKPPIQNAPVENNLMAYNEHYNMLPEEEKPQFLNFRMKETPELLIDTPHYLPFKTFLLKTTKKEFLGFE